MFLSHISCVVVLRDIFLSIYLGSKLFRGNNSRSILPGPYCVNKAGTYSYLLADLLSIWHGVKEP